MKSFYRLNLFAVIFLASLSASYAQKAEHDRLDEYIAKAVKDFKIPGMAVGIIKNGEVVFEKGYGYRNVETQQPVTPETIFGVASVSKAFTAACIGMLVDEGKLNWNDKVTDYLPWFRLHDIYVTNEITIKDLLCHRSGLATFDGDLLWYATDYSRKEIVERIRHLPLKNDFRAEYGYQNVMYIAAGEVIEAVTGKTWDEFVKERIFEPLEMNSSNTSTSEFSEGENWSYPHVNGKPEKFLNYDNSGPAAAINASVDDLLKWLKMWIHNGNLNDEQILSESAVNTITSSQMILPLYSNDRKLGVQFKTYGLGWVLWDYSGRKIVEHSGGLPGVHTRVAFVPEDSLGIVILSNEINFAMTALFTKILDYHLNDKDTDYAADAMALKKRIDEMDAKQKSEKAAERMEGTSPSLPLEDYAGTYEDIMYGKAEIELKDNELSLTLIPTNELFTSKMEHWHLNTFRIKFNDPYLPEGFVTFNFASDGKIIDFKIDLPNPDFHFYNLTFKKIRE